MLTVIPKRLFPLLRVVDVAILFHAMGYRREMSVCFSLQYDRTLRGQHERLSVSDSGRAHMDDTRCVSTDMNR